MTRSIQKQSTAQLRKIARRSCKFKLVNPSLYEVPLVLNIAKNLIPNL